MCALSSVAKDIESPVLAAPFVLSVVEEMGLRAQTLKQRQNHWGEGHKISCVKKFFTQEFILKNFLTLKIRTLSAMCADADLCTLKNERRQKRGQTLTSVR